MNMNTDITLVQQAIKSNLNWELTNEAAAYTNPLYKTKFEQHDMLIFMNNFPDEPLYSVFVDGEEIIYLESIPDCWKLPI
jgi:hypothetical protein